MKRTITTIAIIAFALFGAGCVKRKVIVDELRNVGTCLPKPDDYGTVPINHFKKECFFPRSREYPASEFAVRILKDPRDFVTDCAVPVKIFAQPHNEHCEPPGSQQLPISTGDHISIVDRGGTLTLLVMKDGFAVSVPLTPKPPTPGSKDTAFLQGDAGYYRYVVYLENARRDGFLSGVPKRYRVELFKIADEQCLEHHLPTTQDDTKECSKPVPPIEDPPFTGNEFHFYQTGSSGGTEPPPR